MGKLKKGLLALLTLLVLVVGISTVSFAAASSPTKSNISTTKISVKKVKYNGKKQAPKVTVKTASGAALVAGKDYVVDSKKYKHSGTYKVTIKGIGRYEGTTQASFTIKGTATKKQNKITAKAKTTSFKASSLKKKKATTKIKVTKASSGNKGKVTYKVTSAPQNAAKYISVNSKGKVTLKKGAKKGTYKVKVSVAGYKKYAPRTKTVKFVVK